MKAYFDILWSSFQSSLKQVFIAPSSKVQNVNAGSHCNFMIFQWKPDLTFGKWSKNCNNGHTKQAPVAKNAENCPQNCPNSSFEAWKWVSIFYPFCVTTLVCICGTLVPKTKLKCTKNFKALYLSLTKSNGTVFWCFGTDMCLNFPLKSKKEREGESLALLQIWHLILSYVLGLIDLDKYMDK